VRVLVQKWGNSLAMRIPGALAAEARVAKGSAVELILSKGRLVATPVREPAYDLDRLLAGVTKDNIHSESDWGEDVGREVW